MDSLTQLVLGASIAGACVPQGQRRKALLAGAVLGTLPDLDVLIDYGDAVRNFTYHRGFSHSLLVLPPFAVLLWLALRRCWAPVRAAPNRWLAAILLALVTHPLLDAHTAYGTQLFWPLESPPVMWSTLFIIDPLYTLPLVIGALLAALRPAARWAAIGLSAGLFLSTAYLAWSWVGKAMIEQNARQVLANRGIPGAPLFSTPTPFNTLLWRVVVLTDSGYLQGYDSLLVDERPMRLVAYASDKASLQAASHVWAVQRLRWFAHDFLKAEVKNDRLLLTDLRMGAEPNYVFTHAVAQRASPNWRAMGTQQIIGTFSRGDLDMLRRRLWHD
ncbi:MAG: metal-dependent hydrolase [Gammaproteobacteria bacterium]|nr:metal-dependent hydrolase [Gammaproteobacteria bacterium]